MGPAGSRHSRLAWILTAREFRFVIVRPGKDSLNLLIGDEV